MEKIEKFLNEIYDINYKVMCVDSDEWKNIKNEFILNVKKNITYEFIPEKELLQKKKTTKFENITNDIFGNEVENVN